MAPAIAPTSPSKSCEGRTAHISKEFTHPAPDTMGTRAERNRPRIPEGIMTNHPAPLPVIASTDIEYCDECFIPSDEWPSGLVSVHREAAIGGCDFRACPDCAPAVIRGIDILIRNGGSYATKMYYWFKGSDHAV